MRMEISRGNAQFSAVVIDFQDEGCQITIEAVDKSTNIVKNFFTGMSALFLLRRYTISTDSLIGNLMSCDESADHLCGSVLPVTVLETICSDALSIDSVRAFLKVSCCLLPIRVSEHSTVSSSKSISLEIKQSVELPAHAIWRLLILSECFGALAVLSECKKRLAKLFLSVSQRVSSPSTTAPIRLPTSAMRDMPKAVVAEVEAKIMTHLLRFGTTISEPVVSNAVVVDDKSTRSGDDSEDCWTSTDTIDSCLSEHEPAPSAEAFLRSLRSSQQRIQQQQPQQQRVLQDWSPNSAQGPLSPSDLQPWPASQTAHSMHVRQHREGYLPFGSMQAAAINTRSVRHLHSSPQTDCDVSSIAESINSWGTEADELHNSRIQLDRHLLNNPFQERIHSRKLVSTEQIDYLEHKPQPVPDGENQLPKSSNSSRHQSAQHCFSGQNFAVEPINSFCPDFSVSEWQQIQDPGRGGLSVDESSMAFVPHTGRPTDFIDGKAPNKPKEQPATTPNRSSSRDRSHRSWNASPRFQHSDIQTISVQPLAASKSSALSPDDLKLSREIALIRLRETKAKTHLEASKVQAEKAIRENRLKTLELKTAVLRIGGLPHNADGKSNAINSDRRTPRSASRSPHRFDRTSSNPAADRVLHRSEEEIELEEQFAEEARIRAMHRVKQKKSEIEEMDHRAEAQRMRVREELFQKRDEKIQRFLERKAMDQRSQSPLHSTPDSHVPPTAPALKSAERFRSPVPASVRSVNVRFRAEPSEEQHERYPPAEAVYSREALAAVGLGMSPSLAADRSPTTVHSHRSGQLADSLVRKLANRSASSLTQQERQREDSSSTAKQNHITSGVNSESHSNPHAQHSVEGEEWLEVTVMRARKLPECLGGTNAYVILRVPELGEAQTEVVTQSTEPYYGSTLLVPSPMTYALSQAHSIGATRHEVDLVNMVDLHDGLQTKIQFLVYNKNSSISDELLAVAEEELGSLLQASLHGLAVVELFDPQSQLPAGTLDVHIRSKQDT